MQCGTGGVSFQWERPIFRDLPTENPLTDQSYIDAMAVFSLMANDLTCCRDGRLNILMMMEMESMLEP
jgi:hypothetical protein